MLDTFGSFVTVPAIKRLIDGMALNKMNALHWKRQEEEQSDVLRRRTRPRLPHETYSSGDILDVVEYARLRGVQVVPEYELGGKLFGKARNPSGCDVSKTASSDEWALLSLRSCINIIFFFQNNLRFIRSRKTSWTQWIPFPLWLST